MKRYILLLMVSLLCGVAWAQTPQYQARYWFDNDFAGGVEVTITNGVYNTPIQTDALGLGIHTLHLMVRETNGPWMAPQSYLFYRIVDNNEAQITQYHCWFDDDFANRQSGSLTNGGMMLDASGLSVGIHEVNIIAVDGTGRLYPTQTALFYRVPMSSTTEVPYVCWFDDDFQNRTTGVANGNMIISTDALSEGIHTVHLRVGSDESASLQNYIFFKADTPPIVQYEYWYNDQTQDQHTLTAVNNVMDTLKLQTLILTPSLPIRSTYFHYDPNPNGTQPRIFAKNDFHFRTVNDRGYFSEFTKTYFDTTVFQNVEADILERGTTATIAAPYNNAFHWFKITVGIGDSISFKASERCTMQLFSPSGKLVWKKSGRNVLSWNGLQALENGTYYLAVHDAEEHEGNIDISYDWVYKYDVVDWNVHRVGNGGISSINFIGNGFNSLDTIYLIHGTDTLPAIHVLRKDNTNMMASFNFEDVDTGIYLGVFVYLDDNVNKSDFITVELPRDILLEATLEYSYRFLIGTAPVYNFQIANTGNMTAYTVPLHLRIESKKNGIGKIKIDGLDLPSIVSMMDMSDLTEEEKAGWRKIAEEYGDGHHFYKSWAHDTVTGDSSYVLANYFLVTLAPYETKQISVSVVSLYDLEINASIPDSITPMKSDEYRKAYFRNSDDGNDKGIESGSDAACCAAGLITCTTQLISDRAGIAATVESVLSRVFAGNPEAALVFEGASLITSIAGCICDVINLISKTYSKIACDNDGFDSSDLFDMLGSLSSTVMDCLSSFAGYGTHDTHKKFWKEYNMYFSPHHYGPSGLDIAAEIASLISIGTSSNCFKDLLSNNVCDPSGPGAGYARFMIAVSSFDPNDIIGYTAESGSYYVGEEQFELPYIIEFENDPVFATAPAHTVVVSDTLNPKFFDLSSFSATGFGIGDNLYSVDGGKEFVKTVDLRPALGVLAEVRLQYNERNGIAQWTFRSLDPTTLEEITDPDLGFLPVNDDNNNGVGEVFFTINRKNNLHEGDTIKNRANIVFDVMQPIATQFWHNIMDFTPPISEVDTIIYGGTTAKLSVDATDNLSGAWRYNVYGLLGEAFMPVATNILVDSVAKFDTAGYHYDAFITSAVDSAGNVEPLRIRQSNIIPYSVQLNITAGKWFAISSPVNNTTDGNETVQGVTNLIGNDFDYDLFHYDEPNATWVNYKSSPFDLSAGKGYIYRRSSDATLLFTGQPNSASITVPLSASCSDINLSGFNLIGNPYPHTVSYAYPYYDLRPNGIWYAHVDGTIDIAQGFLVRSNSEHPSYTFTLPQDLQSNNNAKGNMQSSFISFAVSGNGYEDIAYAMFDEGEELPKMAHFNSEAPSISIPVNGRQFAIAVLDRSTEEFPLTINALPGEYAIKTTNPHLPYLHLIDKLTGTDRDLLNNTTYSFSHLGTQSLADRFIVRLAPSLHGGENGTFAYSDGNAVVVSGKGTLQVFDMLGRLVFKRDVNSSLQIPLSNFHTGVYLLRLGDKSQKLVIRK